MSSWEYAEMSVRACAAGGPERYEKQLMSEGAKSVCPWLVLATVGVVVLAVGNIRMRIKEQKRKRNEVQKEELSFDIKREVLDRMRDKKCKINSIIFVS